MRSNAHPFLALQYPDPSQGRAVAMAVSRNRKALVAFKEAVLEDARLGAMDWEADEVLTLHRKLELDRLEALLSALIPDSTEVDG